MSDAAIWPEFIDAMEMGGDGSAISPFTIRNAYDLQAMLFDRRSTKHYRLQTDVDGSPADDFAGGFGFLAIPAYRCRFPWTCNQDVDVTGTWDSYPALVPNQLHTNLQDYHLDDQGPIDPWWDFMENDGDDSYVEEVDQTFVRLGVNLRYDPPDPYRRKLPINFGGDTGLYVSCVIKRIGTIGRARPCVKVGGTWYSGGMYNSVGTSYGHFTWVWWLNPATGSAWTREELLGTAASHNLEAWGLDVEGSASTTIRCTKIIAFPVCSHEVAPEYEHDDTFEAEFDGNGKVISDLLLNGNESYCGMFWKFAGEAFNFRLDRFHSLDDYYVSDAGAFAHEVLGYVHDVEVREPDLKLMGGGAFAYDLHQDGFTSDGLLCENIKVTNPHIYLANEDYGIGGFACGLYSDDEQTATVRNCHVKNGVLDMDGEGILALHVAGFLCWAGYQALVDQCWCSGSIECDQYAFGFIIDVGGIDEANVAEVRDCYCRMELTEVTGDAGAAVSLGGFMNLIGDYGTVENCYSADPVMSSPYSLRAGFILNTNVDGTLTRCHFDGEQTPHDLTDGATENTTTEMKTQSTFTDWDFVDIWSRDDAKNDGYPYLQDALPSGPPEVYSCTPGIVRQGDTNKEVVLAGFNFTLVSSLDFHAGITIVDFDIDSDTQITAHITVAEAAALGFRDIDATSVYGTGTLVDGMEVQESPPAGAAVTAGIAIFRAVPASVVRVP